MDLRGTPVIELLDAFAAGVYLLFGVIHLDLWLKRRDRHGHLWLATASGGALMVDLSGMALRGAPVTSGVLPLLNLLGVVTVTASLYELVLSLAGRASGQLVRWTYAAATVLALLGGLAGIRAAVPALFVVSSSLLLLAMAQAFRAGRSGDREARAMGGGLCLLLLLLILDVLRLLGVVAAPAGMPIFGFVIMFLVSAASLNNRYERQYRELVALRHELERRVADRTRELEEVNRQLAEASRTDALTGLPNRRGFLELAGHELERSGRAGDPCNLLMIDLDHFKEINDRHGHAAGDAVLRHVASLLRVVLRAQDVVARWGGEEFIVLLPDTASAAAAGVAEKVREALASSRWEHGGVVEGLTGSFGVAAHRHGQPLELTIAEADRALYRAKEAGRDRVVGVAGDGER
jgi:diguanylate cyclase (GGDEF)-like protein